MSVFLLFLQTMILYYRSQPSNIFNIFLSIATFWAFISCVIAESANGRQNEATKNSTSPFRRPLRIAQIGTPWVPIPPKKYGGTERVAYFLIEELVRRGHNVTLFGTADSNTTSAHLFYHPKLNSLEQQPGSVLWRVYFMWMLEQVRRHAPDFHILHFHTVEHFDILPHFFNRSLTTIHFPIKEPVLEAFNMAPLVSISNDQRTHIKSKPRFVGTVYHGLPRNLYTFTPKPEGHRPYLAYLGRMVPLKAPHWAVQIALGAGVPLKLAGLTHPDHQTYWQETLKPMIDRNPELIEYIGELNDTEKDHFLGNALALVFPSEWSEPFGLAMIESMACGTPVLGRNRGSVPEIVESGVTGLLYKTVAEGVEAVKRIGQLDRATVRKTFEKRFTVEAMVDGYEHIYTKLVEEQEEEQKQGRCR